MTEIEYVTLSLSVWCDTCGSLQRSLVFSRIPLRDEFKISSLNQETQNSFVYSLECFCIVSLLFRLAR